MRSIVESALVVAGSAVAAFAVNGVRADGLPWIRSEPFALFVPCPEVQGEASPLVPGDERWAGALVLDARASRDRDGFTWPGALSVPFDWLSATSPATVASLASSGAERLVVFGDGGDPDSGEGLARELAGKGLRNVFFVPGGAPALRRLAEAP